MQLNADWPGVHVQVPLRGFQSGENLVNGIITCSVGIPPQQFQWAQGPVPLLRRWLCRLLGFFSDSQMEARLGSQECCEHIRQVALDI